MLPSMLRASLRASCARAAPRSNWSPAGRKGLCISVGSSIQFRLLSGRGMAGAINSDFKVKHLARLRGPRNSAAVILLAGPGRDPRAFPGDPHRPPSRTTPRQPPPERAMALSRPTCAAAIFAAQAIFASHPKRARAAAALRRRRRDLHQPQIAPAATLACGLWLLSCRASADSRPTQRHGVRRGSDAHRRGRIPALGRHLRHQIGALGTRAAASRRSTPRCSACRPTASPAAAGCRAAPDGTLGKARLTRRDGRRRPRHARSRRCTRQADHRHRCGPILKFSSVPSSSSLRFWPT